MKKILALLFLLASAGAMSQAPQKLSYQAVVRNAGGELLDNTNVGIRIQLLQGSEFGAAVYVETFTKQTNNNGLLTLEIGTGSVILGTFSSIDWSSGVYYLKSEIDPAGGTAYSIIGTSQLLSVPYALHARNAAEYSETDPSFNSSAAKDITTEDINNWDNKLETEVDGDPANEIITNTELTGTQLKITEAGNIFYTELKSLQYDPIPFPNSLILSVDDQILLNKWIGNVRQKWQTCYVKSVDGASSSTFHTKCNFKGPSVTVIKLNNGHIFGGYTSDSWTDQNSYTGANVAFLFSLTNQMKFPFGYDFTTVIYSHSSYGPTFGGGHDIYVNSSMNLGYCNFPWSFCCEGISNNSSNAATQLLCGINKSTAADITELEVWIQDY